MKTNTILIQDKDGWLLFQDPTRIIRANLIEEVVPALIILENQVNTGKFAAGFLSYESAHAFDPALNTHPDTDFPLLWFGLYQAPQKLTSLPVTNEDYMLGSWVSDIQLPQYRQIINRIKTHLADGDSYQVNYTVRMRSSFSGSSFRFFQQISASQKACFGAYLEFENYTVCSASPELFFQLNGDLLRSRPMKGTAPRGRYQSEDLINSRRLWNSPKDRAENVMIVDMLRNDMGKISIPGSVEVPQLFEVEKYPTVWQMTSTVSSKTRASVTEIIRALFPCASVTGAPKPYTMSIIRNLEVSPRKIYTGAIGMIAPERKALFNVAIRTVLIDRNKGEAEYGVGGGIVWDSTADDEFHECEIKTRVLLQLWPDFQLIESLFWSPETGYTLMDYHLDRLVDSARYFDYPVNRNRVQHFLKKNAQDFPETPLKVRLLLHANGMFDLRWEVPKTSDAVRIRLAKTPVDPGNIFLYHKTTNRWVYDKALAERMDADDVILWNQRGEITEASSSNIVLQLKDDYVTPPVNSGLLPGTRRAELMDQGKLKVKILYKTDLENADQIILINSVRPWRKAVYLE
jgi:para-aminobenzoate synthetase/4-amino-4-deoxychorismate lyase